MIKKKFNFNELQKNYIKNGYYIFDIIDKSQIHYLKKHILECSKNILKIKNFDLNDAHKHISKSNLNNFRVKIINKINNKKDFEKTYYDISKTILHEIVGNELAMQNEISLSIQLPNDDSSLLPMHADTWSGNSPFEVVIWIPLVDVYSTKSMFILKNSKLKKFNNYISKNTKSSINVFNKFKNDFKFLNIKYGQALIFNLTLPHGNVVNKTKESRWSMNCRFKSLFSPYNFKKFGEVFKPISIKPASLSGMNYRYPAKTNEDF